MNLKSQACLLLVIFCVLWTGVADARPPVIVSKGILDCRSISVGDEAVSIDGSWEFYPHQLLEPNSFGTIQPEYKEVPSWWAASSATPPLHFGTFRVLVLLAKKDVDSKLALDIPGAYSAYSLWVNGKLVGKNGKVGPSAAQVVPQWKPETYTLESGSDTLEVVIQVANFYHHRSGINDRIQLGHADQLQRKESFTEITDAVLFFTLIVFALIAFIVYRRKPATRLALIFYACLCLSWAFRSIFSNHSQMIQWFPNLNWNLAMRVEYITIYLSTLSGSLVVGALFPKDVGKTARAIYLTICSVFTLFTLFTAPLQFSRYVQLYLLFSSILLVSILVIVFRAYLENRQGMGILIYCLFFAAVLFGYVILSYEGLFNLNPLLFNGGFLLLFFAGGIATLNRLDKVESGEGDMRMDKLNFR